MSERLTAEQLNDYERALDRLGGDDLFPVKRSNLRKFVAAAQRDLAAQALPARQVAAEGLTPPEVGKPLLCLVCAYEKPWGVFDSKTGAAVCIDCRDARQKLVNAEAELTAAREECERLTGPMTPEEAKGLLAKCKRLEAERDRLKAKLAEARSSLRQLIKWAEDAVTPDEAKALVESTREARLSRPHKERERE